MTINEDYIVSSNGSVSQVQLRGSNTPVVDTEISIDYSYYLARKDLICLDNLGNVVIQKGRPDILRNLTYPIVSGTEYLPLGTITVHPNSDEITIVNHSVDKLSMEDLQKAVKRIEDMEYNQAMTDLDTEALQGETVTDLKGIFTDKFIGFTKLDSRHSEFNASLDIFNEELTLPSIPSINELKIDTSAFDNNIGYIGNAITAPYTSVIALSQPYATTTMLVNPYAVYDRFLQVSLEPSVDNWVDSSSILVNNTDMKVEELRRWWYLQGNAWTESERKKWESTGVTSITTSNSYNESVWTYTNTTTTSVTSEVVLDEAIQYIRVRDINIKGYGFQPYEDGIKCLFDGIDVTLTPLIGNTGGSLSGSVRADKDGNVNAQFTIPSKVACGVKEVKLYSSLGEGNATYTANGRKTVTQVTIFKESVLTRVYDTLAQTFQLDTNTILTGLDIFVATKAVATNLSVQIRNVVNGYPGNICYAEEVLTPSKINISSDATVATHIDFSNPVQCLADTQYCFVILSDSNVPSLYCARIGDYDISTRVAVTRNPYTAGVLFSSSNALTWTAHQDMDLKFNLYRAKFNKKGVVVFKDLNINQADRILLAIDQIVPVNANVNWYYSINNTDWNSITLYEDIDLSILATRVSIKAEIMSLDNLSPMISMETMSLVSFINKLESRYISRNVTIPDGYNNIKVILDMHIPSSTSAQIYYAIDKEGNSWKLLESPSTSTIDEKLVRYEYTKRLDSTAMSYRVKIVLKTSSPLIRPRVKRLVNILKSV